MTRERLRPNYMYMYNNYTCKYTLNEVLLTTFCGDLFVKNPTLS